MAKTITREDIFPNYSEENHERIIKLLTEVSEIEKKMLAEFGLDLKELLNNPELLIEPIFNGR